MPAPLVEFKNVRKRFVHLVVLDGVSFQVFPGESVVIIGASGSGKSVLLKHIVGLLRPDDGEVYFDGKRIDPIPESELMPIRRRCGFLFQMGALFDSLTVGENIAFPLQEHTKKSKEEIGEIVRQKLGMVGLSGIEKKMPGELSGGQKKRVALARAIALDPQLILYDEPTTGLDPIRADVINELIIKLQRELHTTSITVTHDMQSAFKIANRIVMLHEGKIIVDGTPDEIKNTTNPIVRRFVLGEADETELAALK
ncbi:MAG TPA: ABC transporter ATP-binding protein [Tepidisphaeraceae bacterium]|jgi:phospholipid/cholesterol/gamma-HCH transport system ATP-binding protein|nr:ABC transporter ATP-binding protein [Tepidisphaeraceae bacterium]